jgi:hypothetical protein
MSTKCPISLFGGSIECAWISLTCGCTGMYCV